MKKIILILIVTVSSICANAQVDTAAMRQYLTTHPSKTELIEKCRNRLFEAIINNDRAKAEELMYYAKTEFETDKLKALSLDEMWLLAIWLRKYQLAASEMVLDSITVEQYTNQTNRFKYNLFPLLADSVSLNSSFYKTDIENDESLSESYRDFLLLFIKNFELLQSSKSSEIINDASDEYLARYPMSEHETFVRNLIRYKFVHTRPTIDWRISAGAVFNQSQFSKLVNNGLAINMYIGLSYANFVLNANIEGTWGSVNDDIDFNGAILKKGEKSSNENYGINAGYTIHCPYSIAITPTLGIGWFRLVPGEKAQEKNEDLIKARIKGKIQPVIAVEVDYEIEFGLVANRKGLYDQLIFSPSLRYSYMPINIDTPTLRTSGAIHTVTIGLKYGFEKLRRDI